MLTTTAVTFKDPIIEAKVVPIICIKVMRGNGEPNDVCRIVNQYWSQDGELLAERDAFPATHTSSISFSTLASTPDPEHNVYPPLRPKKI